MMRSVLGGEVIGPGRNGRRYLVVALCLLVLALDGIDVTVVGYLAPRIRQSLQLSLGELSPLFGAGLIGLLAGSLLLGPLADRSGRRPIILLSILEFALATVATAFATSLTTMVVLRFAAGIGLGAAMPNAVTLAAEYAPERQRGLLVSLAYCGFTLGAAAAGLAVSRLSSALGWRAIMATMGAGPLCVYPLVHALLPESLSADAASPQPRARRDTMPLVAPLRRVLAKEMARTTLLFWTVFFLCLLLIQLFVNWLPTFLRQAGSPFAASAEVMALFQLGGAIGSLLIGAAMARLASNRLIAASFAGAAVSIVGLGRFITSPPAVAAAAFATGFLLVGGFIASNAFATWHYPMECRATGISWANGIGRGGAIVGAFAGSSLLALQLTWTAVFALVALPAAASAAAAFALRAPARSSRPQTPPATLRM